MLNACLEETHVITAADVQRVSAEIADEIGQVADFGGAGVDEEILVSNGIVPEPGSEELSQVSDDIDVPIPHVDEPVVFDLEAVDEARRSHDTTDHGIPDYNEDRGDAEVIDLTIRASEDLSLEAELRLKKRAMHTVIDFFGGRGS